MDCAHCGSAARLSAQTAQRLRALAEMFLDAVGRRNYAMLLLIARLGLRAPELVAIQLEDIDWGAGEIRLAAP
jgi:integrase